MRPGRKGEERLVKEKERTEKVGGEKRLQNVREEGEKRRNGRGEKLIKRWDF